MRIRLLIRLAGNWDEENADAFSAYAAKALKELHESQVIAGKAAGKQCSRHSGLLQRACTHALLGKQIVYHAIQDPADAMSLEDLAAMDAEITTLRETIATTKATEKLLRANPASVNATMSTEELRASVTVLEREKKDILGRLGPLRTGNLKPVLPEEKMKVDKEFSQWEKIAGKRKKICLELWAVCTDQMEEGKTREELWVGSALRMIGIDC